MPDQRQEDLKLLHQNAWDYFSLHANQRTIMFRYYILFLTLYLTAVALVIRGFSCSGSSSEEFTIIISLAFLGVTIVFWFLDSRNRQLIGYARKSLFEIENLLIAEREEYHAVSVFQKDQFNTHKCMGHTNCYRAIFIMAIILCLYFLNWSICSLKTSKANCWQQHIILDSPALPSGKGMHE